MVLISAKAPSAFHKATNSQVMAPSVAESKPKIDEESIHDGKEGILKACPGEVFKPSSILRLGKKMSSMQSQSQSQAVVNDEDIKALETAPAKPFRCLLCHRKRTSVKMTFDNQADLRKHLIESHLLDVLTKQLDRELRTSMKCFVSKACESKQFGSRVEMEAHVLHCLRQTHSTWKEEDTRDYTKAQLSEYIVSLQRKGCSICNTAFDESALVVHHAEEHDLLDRTLAKLGMSKALLPFEAAGVKREADPEPAIELKTEKPVNRRKREKRQLLAEFSLSIKTKRICGLCGFSAGAEDPKRERMMRHLYQVHYREQMEEEVVKRASNSLTCPACKVQFENVEELSRHW